MWFCFPGTKLSWWAREVLWADIKECFAGCSLTARKFRDWNVLILWMWAGCLGDFPCGLELKQVHKWYCLELWFLSMKKHKIPNIMCISAKAFEHYRICHSEEVQGAEELCFIVGDRTWVNGMKLHQDRFRFDILGNDFFVQKVVGHWNRLPREVVMTWGLPEFRKHLENTVRNVVWFLEVSWEGPGVEDLCGSLPSQDILRFYDPKIWFIVHWFLVLLVQSTDGFRDSLHQAFQAQFKFPGVCICILPLTELDLNIF